MTAMALWPDMRQGHRAGHHRLDRSGKCFAAANAHVRVASSASSTPSSVTGASLASARQLPATSLRRFANHLVIDDEHHTRISGRRHGRWPAGASPVARLASRKGVVLNPALAASARESERRRPAPESAGGTGRLSTGQVSEKRQLTKESRQSRSAPGPLAATLPGGGHAPEPGGRLLSVTPRGRVGLTGVVTGTCASGMVATRALTEGKAVRFVALIASRIVRLRIVDLRREDFGCIAQRAKLAHYIGSVLSTRGIRRRAFPLRHVIG